MMNKETYKRELVRMWDSLRDEYKGEYSCFGVNCEFCPLGRKCERIFSIEIIEAVEKWSKKPKAKYNVSQLEYDILKLIYESYKDCHYINHSTFKDDLILNDLIEKGYFQGATKDMLIKDYLNDCEVEEK